jgi:hypothetical protein
VFAAAVVPQVLLLAFAGAVADWLGRRRVMLVADVLRGTAQAGLAVALFAGRPAIWLSVLGLAVGVRAGLPLTGFERAHGGDRAAGAAGKREHAVRAGRRRRSYLGSVLALSLLRMPRPEKAEGEQATAGDRARRTLFADMAEGWSDFRSRSWLWVVTVQFAFFNHLLALPDIPMALHAAAGWVGAAAFACGAGAAVSNTFFGTALQQQVPPGRLARINSLTMFPAYGVGVIGYAIDGPLASVVGAPLVFGVGRSTGW